MDLFFRDGKCYANFFLPQAADVHQHLVSPRALSTNQGDRAGNAWYKLRSYNQPGPLSTGQSTSQASARPPHKAALLNATQGLPKTGRLREPCRS